MDYLNSEYMTESEYDNFIKEKCKEQPEYEALSESEKEDLYNNMYEENLDCLGKACVDCRYLNWDRMICLCSSSENMGKRVKTKNYCKRFASV